MKLFNTEKRKVEPLSVQEKGKVSIYNCGPTVYNYAHLGNFRTYVNVDFLRRSLKFLGYEVKEVMNITDLEDKIIRDSQKQNIFYKDLTKKYEKIFLLDMEALNIEKPEYMPRATDAKVIKTMVKIIQQLIDTGFAYKSADGSVYFSIKAFKDYGRLSGLKTRDIKIGARISQDEYEKENAQDFVLWKKTLKDEPSWPTPFGIGRPGWHIECSAMALMYLGESIDIHAGGVDLIFPHHENEIAQTEAYTGKKFVGNWFHPGHLLINGQRMGKSLNNFYTLRELESKFSVEPLAFRLLCAMSHYRDVLNFTDSSIRDAKNTLDNLRRFVDRITQSSGKTSVKKQVQIYAKQFKEALEDDLSMPKATAAVFSFITEINKISSPDPKEVMGFIDDVDKVLGLGLKSEEIEANIQNIFKDYLLARKNKDWEKSDILRTEISDAGWVVEDLKCDSILRRK